jgi:hypothetical protein
MALEPTCSPFSSKLALLRLVMAGASFLACGNPARAQEPTTAAPVLTLPDAPVPQTDRGIVQGLVTDTSGATIPKARVALTDIGAPDREKAEKEARILASDDVGAFRFTDIPAGVYRIHITAQGFSEWKVEKIELLPGEHLELPPIELGVEAIKSSVDAISSSDLAELQITAEEHQRILGVLPNFFVSYVPNAQPLTSRQKFKLALVVSRDPLTFFTTGVNAGIEQWQGDFAGYGQGFAGYASRYAAGYGDRLSATFFGAAIYPSLFHQDPRDFYRGHGHIATRFLYAISTVVICKGDNGKWQPNYSNVLGNLTSGAISTLYYPNSARHDVQTSVDNIFIGIGEGSIGTLFQEFLLRHLTHGAPKP